MLHTFICKNCKKTYERRNKTKFCSLSCSSKYNKNGGDRSSLKYFIDKYGETEGIEKYNTKLKKSSASLTGKTSPMKGKFHSEETKKKLSKSIKNSEYHGGIRNKRKTKEEREKISKYMKGVFSLEWFINKYGVELGSQKYQERSENIKKSSYFNIYNKINKNNYSKKSQTLFWEIHSKIETKLNNIYFSELNHEYSCGTCFNFDFVCVDNKKIIEFNGDLFHANPTIFTEYDTPNPYRKTLTSKEIWDFDRYKNKKAIDGGYSVFIVWEKDFNENFDKCVSNCVDFLIGESN